MSRPHRNLKPAIAVTRFGMGAKPGELAKPAHDPEGWLAAARASFRPDGSPLISGLDIGLMLHGWFLNRSGTFSRYASRAAFL